MSGRGILHFPVGELACLGVPVGEATGRGAAFSKIVSLKGSPGWLVDSTGATEWKFSGTVERDGQVFLYGPEAQGGSLDSILALPLAEALPFLCRLADALVVLEQRGKLHFPMQTDAVVLTEAGPVLFLPPEVMKEIRGLSPFSVNADTFESITHPDLDGQEQASFSLAVMVYRIVTGKFPFSGSTAEEVHEQARKLEVFPPDRIVPGLEPAVSECVMKGLRRAQAGRPTKEPQPTVADWAQRLKSWQSAKLVREVGPEEAQRLQRESSAGHAGAIRRFRRRTYWAKNWKVALVVAVAVVGLGAAVASYLTRALAPRPTRGFAPRQVVETFYLAMNSLDSVLMEACVVGEAGKPEITEVTNFFVVSRVTLGYEGRSSIIPADRWDQQGRPALASPQTVFGVTDLSITAESPEPEPVFLVTYQKWSPAVADADTAAAAPQDAARFEGYEITDRVFLRPDKGDWVIEKIDRLEAVAIGAPY